MSIVKLRRKDKNDAVGRGGVRLDSAWPLSRTWAQSLRRPGRHAIVCLDGYLSMNFGEEDEVYYRRYVPKAGPWQQRTRLILPTQGSRAAPCHVRALGVLSVRGVRRHQ